MIKRLRLKFIAVNMGIVTIMLCVILGLVFHFTRANMENENLRMMQSVAGQPFRLEIPKEPGEDVRLPYFVLRVGPRGELMTTDSGYYDLSDGDFLDDLVDTAFSSPRTFGVIPEYNLRYYQVDMPLYQCLVFSDISSELATLDSLMKNCILIGIISFFLFLGVSILLSRWAVRPVEKAWEQQRQFVADASHELKTPLTVIMTNAELARGDGYEEENRQKFLDNIIVMSRQMKGLTEQMLELARADNAKTKAAFAPVDFSGLVRDMVLMMEPVFYENGLNLVSETAEGITVLGDSGELRQVAEILLDNAVKYTRKGGTVWVTLARCGERHCLLTVADEGEPLSKEDLQNVFKRFYRADKARSRTGSFGLGLSIAESIVTRHRGKIWAGSKDGINSFQVLLFQHHFSTK